MILYSPNPVAFSILDVSVFWYGIILACAVLSGVLYANYKCKDFSLPANFWIDNSPAVIITGILGARLYYCLINAGYYVNYPGEILNIRQGGLSIHGMIIAGILYLYFLSKYKRIRFWNMTDSIACAIPLAQSIGRWGNFFNAEAFGVPTGGQWGLFIPLQNRPEIYKNYEFFHPAFLYESIADIVIFIILLILAKKSNLKTGTITLLYLILYSLVRISIEAIRIDSTFNIGSVHIAQIISGIIIATCLVVLIIRKYN